MSWSIYDTLRELNARISECESKTVADEILVDTIDSLADVLSVYFPNIDTLSDSILAEWRKKQDL